MGGIALPLLREAGAKFFSESIQRVSQNGRGASKRKEKTKYGPGGARTHDLGLIRPTL